MINGKSKNNNNMRLFALNSNKKLAEKISEHLNVPLSRCEVKRFADGEVQIDIEDSIYLILNELKMLIERKTIKSTQINLIFAPTEFYR